MKAVLDEMRLCLLQQSLAHDSGVLSVEELDYRNTDIKKQTINYQQNKYHRTNKNIDEIGYVELQSSAPPETEVAIGRYDGWIDASDYVPLLVTI